MVGHKVSSFSSPILHLLFTDSALIFYKVDLVQIDVVQDSIGHYAQDSRQKVKPWKTSVCFVKGISLERRDQIVHGLGVQVIDVFNLSWVANSCGLLKQDQFVFIGD